MNSGFVDAEAIVSRLEERHSEGGRFLLAFDGDGTLWTGDVGFDLFEALLECGDVRQAARAGLASEAASVGLEADAPAVELARSLYVRYQEGRWPHERAFATMAWAFAGWSASEVKSFSQDVVTKTRLAARLRSSLRRVVAWAQAKEVDVFVVSASPRAIVEHGALLLGIPPAHVLAMTPEVDGSDVLLPRLTGHVIYGDGKYDALRQAKPEAAILGAFGDSFYDAPMLRASRVPVAVAPSAGLVEILDSIPGVVVLPE